MSVWLFMLATEGASRHHCSRVTMRNFTRRWVPPVGLVIAAWMQSGIASAADAEPCRIRGVAEPDVNTDIFDDQGQPIARLTGSVTPIEVLKLPDMPSARARIVTSIAEVRGIRIEGLASVRSLGIRAKTRIDVVPDLVALSAGVRLDGVVQVNGEIFVEKRVVRDFAQTFAARATCEMLGFGDHSELPEALPAKARAYRLDNEQLPLFDSDSKTAEPRMHLTRNADVAPVLFFAVKTKGSWVSLRYDGEISVTAWAHKQDLTALPPGELQDRLAPPVRQRSIPKLAIGQSTRLIRATQTVPLRQRASSQSVPIGQVDAEAEFYVIEVVSGWASVVPRSLAVVPAADRHFWVEAKAIGL